MFIASRPSSILVLLAALTFAGCLSEATPRPDADRSSVTDRASDGLLHNPLLQRVVELQTARDENGLAVYLSHSDPLVRARAAFGSASMNAPSLVPMLVDLLDDPDPRVRADAAFAIGQFDDSTVSQALVSALEREHEVVARARIIEAIGKTGTAKALHDLVTMEHSLAAETEVALTVARFGVRDIHGPESVEWVARRLSHPEARVRLHASYYFGLTPMSQPWALHAAYVRDALEDYAMDDPAAMNVALGLGRFHGADGQLMLSRLSEATGWRVRASTALALASLSSDPRVIAGLLNALDDTSPHVAHAAANSLLWSESLDDTDLNHIESWITQHPDNRSSLVPLLSVLATHERNTFVLDQVRDHVKHDRPGLSDLLAAVALVRSDDAFTMLSGLARSSTDGVGLASLEALIQRWTLWRGALDGVERFFEVFAEGVNHRDARAAVTAAAALTDDEFLKLGAMEHIENGYVRLSTDAEYAVLLLETLGETGDDRFLPIARRADSHENPMVRRAAAQTVSTLTGRVVTVEDWFTAQPDRIDWSLLAGFGPHPVLQLATTRGTIAIELAVEQAPHTIQSLIERVQDGEYDGSAFHRVVPNFIVQGGNIPSKGVPPRGPNVGRTEYTRVPFRTGAVGMANVGHDTEGAQFFITHSMQPQLDGSFSAFGYVIEGMEVVDRLERGDSIIEAKVVPDPATS